MLHKDYDRKGSVAKKKKGSGREPQRDLAPRRTDWLQTASSKVTLTICKGLKYRGNITYYPPCYLQKLHILQNMYLLLTYDTQNKKGPRRLV
jgi:hypothetical protein